VLVAPSLQRVFKRIPLGFGDYDTCPMLFVMGVPKHSLPEKGKEEKLRKLINLYENKI
jgi:hypothetical protein